MWGKANEETHTHKQNPWGKRQVSVFLQIPGVYLDTYLCQVMPEEQTEKD